MYLILVENKFISSRGIKALLNKNKINCEVVNCSTSEGLLDISRKLSPEILVIDFDIFAGNAVESIVTLRRDNPDAYILGLINNGQYEKLQHAIKLGIDDYMVKPLQINELILRVMIAIRRQIKSFGKLKKDFPFEPREIPTISQTKVIYKPDPEELIAAGEELHDKTPAGPVFSCLEEKACETSLELAEIEIEAAVESIYPIVETSIAESSFDNPECNEQPEAPIVYGNCNNSSVPGKASVNKLVSLTKNVLTFSLLLFLFVLSFLLIHARIGGGTTALAGYRMHVVLSGSMSPVFDPGSLVFVKPTDPVGIKEGDIISFSSTDDPARFTIHRVVQVNHYNGLSLTTRGDASSINNSYPVKPDQVAGKVTGSIPYLGYLFTYAQSGQGLILLIFMPLILIMVFKIRRYFGFKGKTKLTKILTTEPPGKDLLKSFGYGYQLDDADPGKVKAPGRMCHLLK